MLNKEKANKILAIARQAGLSPNQLVKLLYSKKITPFRSDSNLSLYIKRDQFAVEWAQAIAILVGKRSAELAAKIREEIIMQ